MARTIGRFGGSRGAETNDVLFGHGFAHSFHTKIRNRRHQSLRTSKNNTKNTGKQIVAVVLFGRCGTVLGTQKKSRTQKHKSTVKAVLSPVSEQ